MNEYIYPYLDDHHGIECPYCGTPITNWKHEDGEIYWEEAHCGYFRHDEVCPECKNEINYRIHFVLTCGVVETEDY